MLQKCGNKAHPSTGVWIMYMEMIWWVWESVWLKCHMAYITPSSPSLCVEHQGQSPLLISESLTAHERNEKIIHSCTNHLWLFRMSTILSSTSFVQQTPGSHTVAVSLAQSNWTLSKCKTTLHLLDTHVEFFFVFFYKYKLLVSNKCTQEYTGDVSFFFIPTSMWGWFWQVGKGEIHPGQGNSLSCKVYYVYHRQAIIFTHMDNFIEVS